jgi:hypothetical protein
MMSVNKYTVNFSQLNSATGATINLPINLGYQLVDQDEIVQTKFVDVEIEKNVNDILDYDKVKLIPVVNIDNSIFFIDNITYRLHFLNNLNQFNPSSYFGEIGFDNFDIKFRKKGFTQSFLRLNFYDSDSTATQRLLSYVTLFTKIYPTDYSTGSIPPWGTISSVNDLKVQFILGNSIINRSMNGEGFFLYHYKDEVLVDAPKELFMRAEFSNAKNGKTTGLMSTNSTTTTIDNLVVTTQNTNLTNNIFTKYILKKENGQYFYEIDTNYSTNVEKTINNYTIDLYQITAI